MSEFEIRDSKEEQTQKEPDKNTCNRALRLELEQNTERFELSVNSISVITNSFGIKSERIEKEQNANAINSNIDAKRKLTSTKSDTRYTLGVDFVITALLAVAGITKVRQHSDHSIQKEQNNPKDLLQTEDIDKQYSLTSSSGYWPNHSQKRATFIIGINDCLNKIANTFYHDPNVGWLIADLNKHRLSERIQGELRIVSIAALQILDLPFEEEIIQFQKSRSANCCAENLVTVVLQNTIDKQKLEETLAPVVPRLIGD